MAPTTKRQNKFRGVKVTLDCGCEFVIVTSFYRLTKARAACIAGSPGWQWCFKCGGSGMVAKFHGTCAVE